MQQSKSSLGIEFSDDRYRISLPRSPIVGARDNFCTIDSTVGVDLDTGTGWRLHLDLNFVKTSNFTNRSHWHGSRYRFNPFRCN